MKTQGHTPRFDTQLPIDTGGGQLTVGVIGGLGPAATMDFCNRVIRLTPVEVEQDHLHLIIDNNPKTPNRNHALEGTGPSPARWLSASAQRLEAAGADFLVMPCNTAHAYAGAIVQAISIPFINIVEETTEWVRQMAEGKNFGMAKVGLLAADGCLRADLYQGKLRSLGIETICLGSIAQERFMQLVYEIKSQGIDRSRCDQMKGLADALIEQGAGSVIAGCTEIPLVLSIDDISVPLVDSTEILANQCVTYAMLKARLPVENFAPNELSAKS